MCTNITLSFVSSWCSISTIWQLGRAGSWVAGSGPEGEESPLSSASAPLLAELVVLLLQLPQSLSGDPSMRSARPLPAVPAEAGAPKLAQAMLVQGAQAAELRAPPRCRRRRVRKSRQPAMPST